MRRGVPLMGRSQDDRERIRALNDEVRREGPQAGDGVHWVFTRGVIGLGPDGVDEAIHAVTCFDAFDGDNDLHGEHDFGSFKVAGERLFWKIDYYDRSLSGGSPNPGDSSLTCRVLTIMLALDY
jgi:hypothetical protein